MVVEQDAAARQELVEEIELAQVPRQHNAAPLERMGTVEEVAALVAFLLSEEGGYLTGQVIAIDGGATVTNTTRPPVPAELLG